MIVYIRNQNYLYIPPIMKACRTLIEALNNEIPIIAFNSSGVEDLLLKGKGGEIIYKMNSEEFLNKINYSLNHYDEALKKTFSKKTTQKIFTVEIAGQKYISKLRVKIFKLELNKIFNNRI